jgi:hypothetical protein
LSRTIADDIALGLPLAAFELIEKLLDLPRVARVACLLRCADNLPTRLVAEPAINHTAENPADQRRDPEQPELRERGAADDKRRAGAARRIDRRVGHRNAHEMNERQAQAVATLMNVG